MGWRVTIHASRSLNNSTWLQKSLVASTLIWTVMTFLWVSGCALWEPLELKGSTMSARNGAFACWLWIKGYRILVSLWEVLCFFLFVFFVFFLCVCVCVSFNEQWILCWFCYQGSFFNWVQKFIVMSFHLSLSIFNTVLGVSLYLHEPDGPIS